MKDIAARLNLSQTTVSHVLTGKHRHYRISPNTVARVRRTAEELGYRSSALARAFRDRKSYAVAFTVADLPNPFWTGVAAGIEGAAEKEGYLLVVSNTRLEEERERRVARMLQEHRIDGLIASPRVENRVLLELAGENLPMVQIDRSVKGLNVPCVRTDHLAGSLEAMEHLAKRGRKHIAFIGGPLEVETYQLRLEGYRKGLSRRGLKSAGHRTVQLKPDLSRAAAKELLSASPRPDAIYTANIWLTIGALRAVKELGLSIPGDLDLVGFDDLADADLFAFPIATVWQDLEAVGREAFKILLKIMNGQKAPSEILIPPRLIVR